MCVRLSALPNSSVDASAHDARDAASLTTLTTASEF